MVGRALRPPKASGEWQSLIAALGATVDMNFSWAVKFFIVQEHDRPIPCMLPARVLVREMRIEPSEEFALWPFPPRMRVGGRRRTRKAGGEARRNDRARGRVGQVDGGRQMAPLADGRSEAGEACDLEDGDPGSEASARSAGSDISDGGSEEAEGEDPLGEMLASLAPETQQGGAEQPGDGSADASGSEDENEGMDEGNIEPNPDEISDGLEDLGYQAAREGDGEEACVGREAELEVRARPPPPSPPRPCRRRRPPRRQPSTARIVMLCSFW